ncbi:MAG: hypothetical protein RLZZ175_2810 [Bacteroidota bacterium]|jgi:uncharacterized protein (TIGR00159 family)
MVLLTKIGFLEIRWVDVVDICLVTFLLFQVYKLIQGSVASRVFIGILMLYLFYQVVKAFEMELMTAILGQFMGVGVIAALILFQQEIRKFLLIIGKTSFVSTVLGKGFSWSKEIPEYDLTPIIEATRQLSATKTGALIVFAKSSELKFYAETGDILDALINKSLILSIFEKNSPMHDGAMIIAGGRIKAARCILPVSDNDELPNHFGLRHRSALGIAEVTDAIVLIVSEETGKIAIAHNGDIFSNLQISDLTEKLHYFLFEEIIEREPLVEEK